VLRREGRDEHTQPACKDAPVHALPGLRSAHRGHDRDSSDNTPTPTAALLPVNPFSREAMKRGVDWASSRSCRTQPRSTVSPPRQARHVQMVAESRAREAVLSDAARREYFETRRAAQRNKLELQRIEASDATTDAASGSVGHPDRVRVNPRVHREWWGEAGVRECGDEGAMVVAAPSKADFVRQRARQRAAEAAEQRRRATSRSSSTIQGTATGARASESTPDYASAGHCANQCRN